MAWMGMLADPGRFKNDLMDSQYKYSYGILHHWPVTAQGCSLLPKDARGDVATATNCDHEIWIELVEDTWGRGLT